MASDMVERVTRSRIGEVPSNAAGLQLAKIFKGDELRLCEPVMFTKGPAGVELVLRRARIAGLVVINPPGELPDHFADILDDRGDLITCVALDAGSFGRLKNHWMRCRYQQESSHVR